MEIVYTNYSDEEDILKYGDENNDCIAKHNRISPIIALGFCILSIDKRATRYVSDSVKSGLESDVMKMQKELRRAKKILLKLHEKGAKGAIEAINVLYAIKYAIEMRNFVEVSALTLQASEKVASIRII